MAHQPPTSAPFSETFSRWNRLRRFEGFDSDEFVDRSECSAAEDAFADRLAALEQALLDRSPQTVVEVIGMIEVITAGEDLSALSSGALARIQAWLGGLTDTDVAGEGVPPDASAIIAVARAELAAI